MNPSPDLIRQVEAESETIWTPEFAAILSQYNQGHLHEVNLIVHIDSIITARVAAARQEAADICGAIYQDHRDQYKGRGKWASQDNPRRADPHADGASDGASECEDAIRALAASQAAPAKAEGWMPIESAPKDGSYIMLGNQYGTWVGKYQDTFQSGWKPDSPWRSMMLNMDHMPKAKNWRPTHWQPIPAAPSTPAKEPTA